MDRYISYQMKNKSTGESLNCKIKWYCIKQQIFKNIFTVFDCLVYCVNSSIYHHYFLVSLEELKQDVSSFRFEILNNLKTLKKERKQDLISLKEEQKAVHQKLDLITSILQRHPVVLGSDQGEATEISEL